MEELHREFGNPIFRFRLKGLSGIFLAEFLRRMTTSLMSLYTPIYIWQLTGKLTNVAIYYLIYGFLAMMTIFPGAMIIKKVGVDWGNGIGTVLRVGYILFLIGAEKQVEYFWLSAICLGLCQSFDWLSYNYVMTKVGIEKKQYGKKMGMSVMVERLGAAIGSLLGGLIISSLGFRYLYMIAGVCLVLVAVLPFWDEFEKKEMHVNFSDLKKAFKDKGIKKHIMAHGLRVFDLMSNMMIWPLYLYLVMGTIKGSGIVQTLTLILAMVAALASGKLVDLKNLMVMYGGSGLVFLGWMMRWGVKNFRGLVVANTSYSLGTTMLWTPFMALIMARSAKKYTMEFWIVKEIISYGMVTLSCLFYLIIFGVIGKIENLVWLFPMIGTVSLLGLKLPKMFKKYVVMIKRL